MQHISLTQCDLRDREVGGGGALPKIFCLLSTTPKSPLDPDAHTALIDDTLNRISQLDHSLKQM